MSDTSALGKMVPGFDFLQSLVKSSGSALPGIGHMLQHAAVDRIVAEIDAIAGPSA